MVDPAQLEVLGYTATPTVTPFEIKVDEFGDIVDDLEFTLIPLEN
jgi:hypothetical protein